MKNWLKFLLFGIFTVVTTVPALAEVREWTRAADGKKISAEFLGMAGDAAIKIKMANGNTFEVSLASLSPADNEYVAGLQKAMASGSSGETKPAAVPEGEVTVTLSGVQMGCKKCEEAILGIPSNSDAKTDSSVVWAADRKEGTVTITAPTGKAAQQAVMAVYKIGFYGASDHESIKIPDLKEDEFTTDTMVVRGVSLICSSRVKDFSKAIKDVDGVDDDEAKTGSDRVKVTGEGFRTYDVMMALRAAGFGGTFQ